MQTEHYTFAQLEQLPDEIVVPFAEPFTVTAKLSEKTEWSPDAGAARYGKQDPVRADLSGGSYEFPMPPQKDPEDLVLAIGDARKKLAIKPTTRPELTALSAIVRLPDYLQYSQPIVKDVRGEKVTVSMVKGSHTNFEGTATRALDEASVDGQPQTVEGQRLVTKPVTVEKSMKSLLTWRDKLGLPAKQPFVLNVIAEEDEAPNIACGELPRQKVVLETEVLSFGLEASDDFGVREIGMEWTGIEDPLRNPSPSQGEKLLAAGQPELRNLQAVGSFSARTSGNQSSKSEVAFVRRRLSTRSRAFLFSHLHPACADAQEHAIWITARLASGSGRGKTFTSVSSSCTRSIKSCDR